MLCALSKLNRTLSRPPVEGWQLQLPELFNIRLEKPLV